MPELKVLRLAHFGNPVLRKQARQLSPEEIRSDEIQELIENIRHTNSRKRYGIGLAAPQVGVSVALSIIGVKPTPTRPEIEPFECVIINPEYTGVGRRTSLWEGCQSSGTGDNTLFARVPRYRKVEATWCDEDGKVHNKILGGIVAHVFQHETDHLNGILFVDRVRDTTSYMLAREYRKRVAEG